MRRKNSTTPLKVILQSPKFDKGKQTLMEENEEETASNSDILKSDSCNSPSCFALLNYSCTKQATEKVSELYEGWRESQRSTASQISRHLKCKWALDSLIECHLSKLQSHCTRTILPAHLPRLLFPEWDPPLLASSLSWLGDTWRPSNLLSLVVPTLSIPLRTKSSKLLKEWIRRFKIEEAVLDEEMGEYQSMSVLNLAAKGKCRGRGNKGRMGILMEEMRKVEGVVERARGMRYRAVEVVVKGGVLRDERQAAEFLVAVAGVEDAVRRQACKWRTRLGAVVVEVQVFD